MDCSFTDACSPDQLRKYPFSAPLALIVSTMRMPFMVIPLSLPLSRCCTRVILTRRLEMIRLMQRFSAMLTSPISVRSGL